MSKGDRFKRRALKRGYKVDEVDDFLERAEATLAGEPIGDPVTPEDVRDVVFRTRWGGYDEWQVDLHLDRLERELEEFHSGAGAQRGSNGFPALPPASADRDRLALPPGTGFEPAAPTPTPTVYVSDAAAAPVEPARPEPARAEPARGEPPLPHSHPEPAQPRFAPDATQEYQPEGQPGLVMEPPYQGEPTQVGGIAPIDATYPEPMRRPDPYTDSFADLTAAPSDYEDPFADHTPKPTFREHFRSSGEAPPPSPVPGPQPPSPMPPPTPTSTPVPEPRPEWATARQPAGSGDPYAGRHGKADMTVELPSFTGQLSPFTNEDKMLLAELRGELKTRRFGSGYDAGQVDRLFDAVAAAMDGQATAQITDADFDISQFGLVQGGYFEDEVEQALTRLRELFKRRVG